MLVFPWILWGLLFGWNLLSPVICNIVLLTITMFVFVWLVKPTWKQLGILTVLFSLYSLFVRYMLSGMPEVICFSLLILFYGLAMSYLKKESCGKLTAMFVISVLLTLMRPYMLLFLALACYFWICRNKKGRVDRIDSDSGGNGNYLCPDQTLSGSGIFYTAVFIRTGSLPFSLMGSARASATFSEHFTGKDWNSTDIVSKGDGMVWLPEPF